MHTKYLKINDNCTIAYDVFGEGPAVVMLHDSLIQNRSIWHKSGYVEKFAETHKVISIDFPCHGESTCKMLGIKDFSIQFFSEIVDIIIQECGVKNYCIIGLNFGGAVAMHLASENKHIVGIVVDELNCHETLLNQANKMLPQLMEVINAEEEDSIDVPELKKNLSFSSEVDLNVAASMFESIKTWKPLKTKEITCPVYSLDWFQSQKNDSNTLQKLQSSIKEVEVFLNSLKF